VAICRRAGGPAEAHVIRVLRSDDQRTRVSALGTLAELGRSASRAAVGAVVEVLREARLPEGTRSQAERALEKMRGVKGLPGWTWRDWARACGLSAEGLSPTRGLVLERQSWDWISLMVPREWYRSGRTIGDPRSPGSPEITIYVETDVPRGGMPSEFANKARYTNAEDMRRKRIQDLAMTVYGTRLLRRPDVAVAEAPVFPVGPATAAPVRVTDKKQGTTSYYVFIVRKQGSVLWYGTVVLSAGIEDYRHYRALFEGRIARSVGIDPSKMDRR
jgi:hypothetical protein